MKRATCFLSSLAAVVTLLSACATGGNKQLPADKLNQITPGVTTRAELVEWFGEPLAIGLDVSGKSSATWMHTRVIAAPFYTDMKNQTLIVIFETNNVVLNFNLSDQIKATNAPVQRATSPKGQ